MNRVSMFGLWGIKKSNPLAAHQMGNRILKLTSDYNTTIVQSQHDYFFIPTTEEKFLI
jgi:hypothetical protein